MHVNPSQREKNNQERKCCVMFCSVLSLFAAKTDDFSRHPVLVETRILVALTASGCVCWLLLVGGRWPSLAFVTPSILNAPDPIFGPGYLVQILKAVSKIRPRRSLKEKSLNN